MYTAVQLASMARDLSARVGFSGFGILYIQHATQQS
jgi:hypothetical protein